MNSDGVERFGNVTLVSAGGPKHLPRYVDEFTFRLNEGNVKVHTLDRLDSFVDGMADKRLTYSALIAKPEVN